MSSPDPGSERSILAVAGLSHAWCHAAILMFSPFVAPESPVPGGGLGRVLGTGLEGTGWAIAAMTAVFGIGAVPAGMLVSRFGTRPVLATFCAGGAIACLLVGLAGSPLLFLVGMLAIGASTALYHPTGLTLVSREIHHRGTGFGIHGALGHVGIATSPFLAFALAGWLGGMQRAFLVFAVPAAVLAVLAVGLPRGPGSEADRRAEEEGRVEGAGALRLGLLLVMLALVGMAYRGMMTYLPALLDEGTSVLGGSGALWTTVALAVGVVGQLGGGRLADRFRGEPLQVAILGGAALALLGAGLVPGPGAVLAAAGAALFVFGQQPVKNSLVARYAPMDARGRTYGIFFATEFTVGALGAGIGGAVAARADLGTAFCVLAGLLALAAGLAGVLVRLAPAR